MNAIEQTAEEAARAIGIDHKTGFATDGNWPVNGRLRAEAMAKAGVTTDPGGVVSDELIAATKDRLDREEAEVAQIEADAEVNAPSLKWRKDDLVAEAGRRGVAIEGDADKAAILAAIEAAPAAQTQEG